MSKIGIIFMLPKIFTKILGEIYKPKFQVEFQENFGKVFNWVRFRTSNYPRGSSGAKHPSCEESWRPGYYTKF